MALNLMTTRDGKQSHQKNLVSIVQLDSRYNTTLPPSIDSIRSCDQEQGIETDVAHRQVNTALTLASKV